MLFRAVLLAVFLVSIPIAALSQEPLKVTAKEIQQHIDHKVFPSYPQKAKAAHIQGAVLFDLRIGATGKIESIEIVSGPEMLRQAAADCLKQWTFHPFIRDGIPVIAVGQYSLIFMLGDGNDNVKKPKAETPSLNQRVQPSANQVVTVRVKSEISVQGANQMDTQRFQEADDACKRSILAKEFNQSTVSLCTQAAELAEQFQIGGNEVLKRSAFVYAATALGDIGDFQRALPWANKAVEVIKLGRDSESGRNAVYSTRAEIEALIGDYEASDKDLCLAEDAIREMVSHDAQNGGESANPYLTKTLARNLDLHVKILQRLNRFDEAQKKIDEASKLR